MYLEVFAVALVIFLIGIYLLSPIITPRPIQLSGAHVLVTGGSSGIGKAVAVEAAKKGANVTLLARNQTRLSDAKLEVESHFQDREKQKVLCISVDVSKDYGAVERAVKQAEEKLGPVTILVNSAGISISLSFEDMPITEFKKQIDVNYIGSVYATRAVIGSMKAQECGRIVFVSSMAGQLGLYGYTAYAASKFALRGFAESLQMEVKPYNIRVCLSFPPDTDTPMFAEENRMKPQESKLICETAGLFQPEFVAKTLIKDAVQGHFLSYMGVDGFMLSVVTCGLSPVISLWEATLQVASMGLMRVISLFYLDSFDRIVQRCKNERDARNAVDNLHRDNIQ